MLGAYALALAAADALRSAAVPLADEAAVEGFGTEHVPVQVIPLPFCLFFSHPMRSFPMCVPAVHFPFSHLLREIFRRFFFVERVLEAIKSITQHVFQINESVYKRMGLKDEMTADDVRIAFYRFRGL